MRFFLAPETANFSRNVSNASPAPSPAPGSAPEGSDFIRKAIREDLAAGRFDRVQTRWPPEPNGYIGIGHAKAITLNFDVAREFGGFCSLRFDDTNPEREKLEYVESIKEDIRWLGFDWGEHEYYASDYYERLYELAEQLVEQGDAYVDRLTAEQISEYRGVPTRPGRESPDRNRPPADSLDLLRRMRAGEFADGAYVLRARIDMASPNLNLRDPVMYRIRRARHYRTGDAWCIYPMYDWAHGQSDSVEGVTHSLCSLEFENNRPLYDWYLDKLGIFHSRQIEFNHLNVGFAVLHKRILRRLVGDGTVHGWDDPRLLTLRGLRRRGYTPSAIRAFVRSVGLTKTTVLISYAQLEYYLREELNRTATRMMAVLDPLKVVITNYPEGQTEQVEVENNPEDPGAGKRTLPFTRELFIERSDFMEQAPRKFFRLSPGREVRLKGAYYITCDAAVKDGAGRVTELRCSYDPASRGGGTADGRRVRGTLHWVSAEHAHTAEVRLYDHLFTTENMNEVEHDDLARHLNPNSEVILTACKVEPGLAEAQPEQIFQFLRHGYFVVDNHGSRPGAPVFNRSVGLRDTWAKVQRAGNRK